jgi:hypothetical protein
MKNKKYVTKEGLARNCCPRRAIELLDAAQAPNALKKNPSFERLGFLFY